MIKLINVSRKDRAGDIDFYALNQVSIEIPAGELVVILGPSGSGNRKLT